MWVRPVLATAITVFAGVAGAHSASPSAYLVAAGVHRFYASTTTFEADFVQTTRGARSGNTSQRDGHVWLARGGRMRWEYRHPSGDMIVSDGTTISLYEAAAHQIAHVPAHGTLLYDLLRWFTGTPLAGRFALRAGDARLYPSGHVIEARPLPPIANVDLVVVLVASGSFQIAAVIVMDAQGGMNRYEFHSPRVNVSPPSTTFSWTPPPGTRVFAPPSGVP